MDYSQLSDFEINKRVAIALNIDMHFFISESEDSFDSEVLPSEMGPIWQTSAHMVLQYRPSNGNCFNPCNSPADAWPIIVDNEISLNSYSGTWEASYEYDAPIGAFGADELVTKAVEGKNPLRTAMIAFLMKREHSNA